MHRYAMSVTERTFLSRMFHAKKCLTVFNGAWYQVPTSKLSEVISLPSV